MLTAVAYILVRAGDMARRRHDDITRSHDEADVLLRAGTISEAEFSKIKAEAFA